MDREHTFPTDAVLKIPPFHYCHVLNASSQVTRVEVGPKTLTLLLGESVVLGTEYSTQAAGPEKMVVVPPRHYVTVDNPVRLTPDGNPVLLRGQAQLSHGDSAIRMSPDPFALYPGEKLQHAVKPLPIVLANNAIRLLATRDIYNEQKELIHRAGEEWQEVGPITFIPRVEARVVHTVQSTVVQPNEALLLRARKDFVDRKGVARKTGDEWQIFSSGSYMPDVDEMVVQTKAATTLTPKIALLSSARWNFVDDKGRQRRVGEQWLLTSADGETHIPDVYETVLTSVPLTLVNHRQYVVVINPVNEETGKNDWGARRLLRGDKSFFLRPGERLEGGVKSVYVLEENQALSVKALEAFEETTDDGTGRITKVKRKPGERWLVYGPREYWPSLEVDVENKLQAFIRIEALKIFLFRPDIVVTYVGLGLVAIILLFSFVL